MIATIEGVKNGWIVSFPSGEKHVFTSSYELGRELQTLLSKPEKENPIARPPEPTPVYDSHGESPL